MLDVNRIRKVSHITDMIRKKLLARGFDENRIINNRGLIGATIDEMLDYLDN